MWAATLRGPLSRPPAPGQALGRLLPPGSHPSALCPQPSPQTLPSEPAACPAQEGHQPGPTKSLPRPLPRPLPHPMRLIPCILHRTASCPRSPQSPRAPAVPSSELGTSLPTATGLLHLVSHAAGSMQSVPAKGGRSGGPGPGWQVSPRSGSGRQQPPPPPQAVGPDVVHTALVRDKCARPIGRLPFWERLAPCVPCSAKRPQGHEQRETSYTAMPGLPPLLPEYPHRPCCPLCRKGRWEPVSGSVSEVRGQNSD